MFVTYHCADSHCKFKLQNTRFINNSLIGAKSFSLNVLKKLLKISQRRLNEQKPFKNKKAVNFVQKKMP